MSDSTTDIKSGYRVSVVIPAYNSARCLEQAIDSVLIQALKAHEIIVVDDGSEDDTATIVRSYQDHVRYLHQDNAGPSAARNTGVAAATGDWVGFLDADDEWLPVKLERQVALLQRNPELMWTTGNYLECRGEHGRRSAHLRPAKATEILAGADHFADFFAACVKDARGCTDTMLIKREVLEEVGPFAVARSRGEDLDMWWRIAYRWGKIGYDPEPLAVYHLGAANSLTRQYLPLASHYELMERHLKLSADCGQGERFRPCAAMMVRQRIRSLLFEGRGGDVRELLRRLGDLLSPGYRIWVRAFSWFGPVTSAGCRAISWIVRHSSH